MILAPQIHLPTSVEVITTKRPRCVVYTTEKNIGMKHYDPFHIQPMLKIFICACVTCAVHVHSGVHLKSK